MFKQGLTEDAAIGARSAGNTEPIPACMADARISKHTAQSFCKTTLGSTNCKVSSYNIMLHKWNTSCIILLHYEEQKTLLLV